MDRSTQQNAAMVEETSAAARNLTQEVNALADQANQFQVEGGPATGRSSPGQTNRAVRLVRSTPAAAAKPAKIAKPAIEVAPALLAKPLAAANGAAHDDWHAF